MKKDHPEIAKLKSYLDRFIVDISRIGKPLDDDLFFVELSINGRTWKILVDDEYRDFSKDNRLMNLFLVFNSIELYVESDDFLTFSNQLGLDPANVEWQEFYRDMATTYREIENVLGEVDSCITPLDYQLRTGVVDALMSYGS